MEEKNAVKHFPTVGDGTGLAHTDSLYKEELQLALRNKGMPQEALRYPITPTGMHYLLVHYDIPDVNIDDWRLQIAGTVSKPLSLSFDEVKKRPAEKIAVTMECAGNGRALFSPRRISQPWLNEAVGTSEWTGTSLWPILEEAGIRSDAVEVVFTGLDRGVEGEQIQSYQRSLSIREAQRKEVFLAYEMNGEPIQPQHGYPVRLVVPGWYGMTSVKWLHQIEAVAKPFQGYQMLKAYRYAKTADDPGEPVDLIRVRALMVPPGIPDFMTRRRLVEAGRITVSGKAWAGRAGISRVEVSVDDCARWSEAQLEKPVSAHAWTPWTFVWNATPGNYVLCARATDAAGNIQPLHPQWNFGGYGNNAVQRVNVLVE